MAKHSFATRDYDFKFNLENDCHGQTGFYCQLKIVFRFGLKIINCYFVKKIKAAHKEEFLNKLQNFESALVQEQIPHKLLSAKYFVSKIILKSLK